MGAVEMGIPEQELPPLVEAWREANQRIVRFWYEVDEAARRAVRENTVSETHGIRFTCEAGVLFITLPSGRRLAYAKPELGENRFGSESITYMGLGTGRKWMRLETFGGKLVENITQAVARDILCYAMQSLRHSDIVMHVHDEVIIEADERMSLEAVCEQMSRTPPWAQSLLLKADGYECQFYQKD